MFLNRKKISLNNLVNLLFCILPISLTIGSLVVNINLSLFLILSIIYIKNNQLRLNFNYTNGILICFFIYIIFSTFLNVKSLGYEHVIKSIFLLRFLIFYLVIEILLINNILKLKNLFYACLVSVSFVCVDIITQYILGYNMLGFAPWEGRRTGIFTSEGIGGSYIQRFSLFAIFGSLLFFKKKKLLIFFISIVLACVAVFVASNKMSFLLINFSILILLLVGKNYRLIVASAFTASILISIFLIINDKGSSNVHPLKNQYKNFYRLLIATEKVVENNNLDSEKIEIKKRSINLFSHTRIYYTAIESWKNQPVIGNGHKSFRVKCKNVLHKRENLICSTHPHNYQLEILHNYGLIGFFLTLIFALSIIYKLFRSYLSLNKNEKFYLYLLPIGVTFLVEIWPLKSTGMLFTTWNGTIVWLIISLTSVFNLNKKY